MEKKSFGEMFLILLIINFMNFFLVVKDKSREILIVLKTIIISLNEVFF